MQLTDLFDLSLRGQPDAVGLEYEAGGVVHSLTFGEIDARANRMARALRARDVERGSHVCVQLANSPDFIDIFLACMRIGAVLVPINVLYREREVAHVVTDAQAVLLVTAQELPVLRADAERQSSAPVRETIDGADPAAIVYTSGTTGKSKGAVLSHDNFLANAANLVACWQIARDDRYLAVLPLFHVHGLANGLCCWLATGCRMRLIERFEHQRAAELFDAFQPTLFFGVPTIYVRLLDLPAETAVRIGERTRLFVSGSAPLPAHVLNAFHERFGHAILERYGMSEALMITSNPYAGERRAGTVGFPLPGVSLRIDTQAGAGAGELQIKGANVFAKYWNDPAASAAAFTDDGWFRTGDIGERSDDGYITLRARASDLIISGGYNVYPREIEDVLLEQPGVREAAVVGTDHPLRGEVPLAFVVVDGALDAAALRAACERSLAPFKVPREFVAVDALPRNAMGKVQKTQLARGAS